MGKIHERGYWLVSGDYYTHWCDTALCDAIIEIFRDRVGTAVDIGCGDGAYTRRLIEQGINCVGFDGNPLTPTTSNGLCGVKDFSQPVDIGKYDLVISLEVGEHIPAKYEQTYIDNVVNSSSIFIVLSWGVEGQPGLGHVNCRNNDYVINEIEKRGFAFVEGDSKFLREHSTFPWFANTVMVFIKT